MDVLRKIVVKYGTAISAVALTVTLLGIKGSCRFILNQPEEPECLRKMVK